MEEHRSTSYLVRLQPAVSHIILPEVLIRGIRGVDSSQGHSKQAKVCLLPMNEHTESLFSHGHSQMQDWRNLSYERKL